jgi:hypothetical protein
VRIPLSSLAVATFLALAGGAFAAVEIKDEGGKVSVKLDGQLYTEYVYQGAMHTYFWPLLGPGGLKMTRAYPMADLSGEDHDHPHHRSLWYAHGKVNGVDFWGEVLAFGTKPPAYPEGKIVHEKFLELKGGEKEGVISSQQKWEAPDGTVPLTSTQTVRFHQTTPNERVIDFDVTLQAPADKEAVMEETKEGTMAMRIAETMRLKPNKATAGAGKPTGHLLNSEGQKDGEVWGKAAKWVDYVGPVDDQLVGIAIFDHPSNPRHPTKWHARDYGLFAANPFMGVNPADKNAPKGEGNLTIPAGGSITFKYRIYIHEGDSEQAQTAERYAEYAK